MQETDQQNKALVIHSDPDSRRLLGEILNEQGYQVKGAEEIRAAVQIFKAEVFSLVISEFEFPGLDGMETLDLIRRFGSKVKVVLIASEVGAEVYINARAWGALDCISKSLERSTLVEVLAAIRD